MPKKIDPEVQARAVRLVADHLGEYPSLTAASAAVAQQVGVGRETVRRWVVQAQDDTLTADTAAPFATILDETTKQQALTWAEARTPSDEKSDVVTQDLFLQARDATSLLECARGDLNPHALADTGT